MGSRGREKKRPTPLGSPYKNLLDLADASGRRSTPRRRRRGRVWLRTLRRFRLSSLVQPRTQPLVHVGERAAQVLARHVAQLLAQGVE